MGWGRSASYGPLTAASVTVLVYVPAYVFAGIATWTVGVSVKLPIPVFADALNSLTAVGAVAAAGTPRLYVIPLVGFVQVVPPAQADVTPVTVDAVFERLCVPVVNAVDVIVTFQPAPEPVASFAVIGIV